MRRRRYRKSRKRHEVAREFFASARLPLQLKHYDRIVAVMMPRERWTDERLDDLNKKVDDGFARLDRDIREVREELKNLNRTLIGGIVAIAIAIIGSNVF